jgi:hypothetical protein
MDGSCARSHSRTATQQNAVTTAVVASQPGAKSTTTNNTTQAAGVSQRGDQRWVSNPVMFPPCTCQGRTLEAKKRERASNPRGPERPQGE